MGDRVKLVQKSLEKVATRLAAQFKRLRFLRGNVRLFLFWPVAAILLASICWTLLFAKFQRDKNEIAETALEEAAIIATGHATQLRFAMDNINQLVLLIREQWEASNGRLKLENLKAKGLFQTADPFNVGIVNRNGILQTSTFGTNKNDFVTDVSYKEYFKVQKSAASDFLFCGLPTFEPITRHAVIQFSRRISDQKNQFAGVVLLSVKTDYFTSNYSKSSLGDNGFLGMVGVDGIARVTRIGNTVFTPQSNALPSIPMLSETNGSMLLDGRWFSDKRSRYVGWEFVEGYSLVALAGLDEQESLAPFAVARATAIRTGIVATAILAMFTIIAMALSFRLASRKHEIERVHASYRMATESSDEGFYISHPIRDANNTIIDFEAVDCNERCAELFNSSRDDFIGRKVSYMHDQKTATTVIHMLLQAMKEGQYEGELETNFGEREPRSINIKVVCSGDNLAVTLRDITSEKQHVRELERRSNQDALTSLPNRVWMNSYLGKAVVHASETNTLLAVLFIDLDGFKTVNDSLGHAAGDEVLINAARRFEEAVRPNDHVVRLGGDEFLVIIENIQHEEDAAHVAERVLKAFATSFSTIHGAASIGTSIGISVYPHDSHDVETLLQNADLAMYAAKTNGKHRYQFFDQTFYETLNARLAMENALRQAIEQDQFLMYYQPRVDMSTGRTSSMEALVRWAHPSKGLIEPLEFIQMAEDNGLILELGKLIIDKVCAQIEQWQQSSEPLVPVSINVSSRQFNESNIDAILTEALAKHRIDPALIEIELTESTMMGNAEKVSDALSTIHDLGIKLLIDDFGTGYSSLSQLQKLDFDVLKVDRAFTAELGKTDRGNIFFAAIITMAHALGMRVVAEGVENVRQLKMLKALRCDEIQGFYIAYPVAATHAQHHLFQQVSFPIAG